MHIAMLQAAQFMMLQASFTTIAWWKIMLQHNYLYTNVLRVVDADYKEKDFDWNNTIKKDDSL